MEDDKIESFFRDMKTADENRAVPAFPVRKEPRKLLPVFLYAVAAAVVTILVTVRYVVAPDTTRQPASVVEVDLVVRPDRMQSQSLLENEQDLANWQSPTEFLSTDY